MDNQLDKPLTHSVRNASLTSILERLTRQNGLNFALDGLPMHPSADFEAKGTTREVLDRIADTFDYSWKATAGRVILMNKRFHDDADVPQAHVPEMQQMAREIVDTLNAFPYDPNETAWPKLLVQFANSLTPQQNDLLKSGKPLAASSLASKQQSLLQNVILSHGYAQSHRAWTDLRNALEAMPTASLEADTFQNGLAIHLVSHDKRQRVFVGPVRPIIWLSPSPVKPAVWIARAEDQPTGKERNDSKLDGKVHLLLGKTTVAKAAATLSAQTGRTIEVADYLQSRELIVQMDHLSARNALNALAELNDWRWSGPRPDRYLLARPKFVAPVKAADISLRIAAALPKDLRNYLALDTPAPETPLPANPDVPRRQEVVLNNRTQARIFRLRKSQKDLLISSLQPRPTRGQTYPVKQLAPQQQQELLLTLVFGALYDTDLNLLRNRLAPYQLDPSSAAVELQSNMLIVGVPTKDGALEHFVGFGTPIR